MKATEGISILLIEFALIANFKCLTFVTMFYSCNTS